MKSVLVLGGAGGVGRYAVRVLRDDPVVDRIVVADRDLELCTAFCREQGPKVVPLALDVSDPSALVAAMHDTDLVMSCVGPFFRFGVAVLSAAIEAGRSYVDICDDPEPTLAMLELDARARERGISALVGMGITPGVSNLLAVLAARELDETLELVTGWDLAAALPETIGPEPSAATLHGVEQLSGHIRVFRDGEFVDEPPIDKRVLDVPGLGRRQAYTIGHPEPVTLPRTFPGLRACRNVFTAPLDTVVALRALRFFVDRGILGARTAARWAERFEGPGGKTPRLADLLADARRRGTMSLPPIFALAHGVRAGQPASVLVTLASAPAGGLGGTTGVPLAVAAGMMLRGEIERCGVFAPEAGVDPIRFLDRLAPLCDPPRASCAGLAVTVRSWESTRLLEALAVQLEASSGLDRKP